MISRIILENDQTSLINFIILRGTFHPLLSSAIMQLFKKPETLDFTGKIYKKAFVSVYHILSFARGVKISLWGKNWGKLWGMKTQQICVGKIRFDKYFCSSHNILNKGAGRIACTYPFRRYVLSYRITVQPLAGEWTVIFCAYYL